MNVNFDGQQILVTGATGTLGSQIVFELDRAGFRPIVHVRETSDTRFIDSLGLEKRVADIRQAEKLDAVVAGIDIIIHTIGWPNFRQDRLTQFTGINAMGAVQMLAAAQRAGVKRFLHVSTVAAVGARKLTPNGQPVNPHELVDEDTEFNLDHLRIPYIMTKHAAEKELWAQADNGDTELIMVNPSIIMAPSRSGDDRAKAIKRFAYPVVPEFANRINFVDIRDVAPAVIKAAELGRHGERYILAGDDISGRELALTASALLGKTPHLVRLPRWLFNIAARLSVVWCRLTGKSKISFYPDLVKLLDYDWVYSSRKAREELGYQHRSLVATLSDLLSNHFYGTWLKPTAHNGTNGRNDRKAAESTK